MSDRNVFEPVVAALAPQVMVGGFWLNAVFERFDWDAATQEFSVVVFWPNKQLKTKLITGCRFLLRDIPAVVMHSTEFPISVGGTGTARLTFPFKVNP